MSEETSTHPRQVTGAELILRVLEAEGVEVCFGIPGGAILPLYDALARNRAIRHVLARHEQGAGHMAQGYARAGGRVGVAIATSGPGATNLVTPIADAAMDSTPLLCLTGQVSTPLIGTDAFQECDIVSVVRPLVKGCWLVRDPAELGETVREAHDLARRGRPGPVLVDVPRDVQEALVEPTLGPARAAAPGSVEEPAVAAVAAALETAQRPVLYVGGGCVNAGAGVELTALAEAARVPVVTTLMGKGAIPESHELCFGCPGMHGGKWANWALNMADLIVAVGARFDDRVTGRLDEFAPAARVAHFDVDPKEIGKLRHADLPVPGPLREGLARTRQLLRRPPACAAWLDGVREWRERFPLRYASADGNRLKPQAVVERLDAALAGREVIWTTGVGKHQMWAMQYLRCEQPRSFITSGGHGTMGFGLPAAVGAALARPRATVVCVDGDGSFQMTAQELATAVAEGLDLVVVIVDDGGLGMVRQWQTMFYERRYSASSLSEPADLATVARGFGAWAETVSRIDELDQALEGALKRGGVAVLDVHVEPGEGLYPMIRPGAAAVDMIEYPGDQASEVREI